VLLLFALLFNAVPPHDYGTFLLVICILMISTATKNSLDGIHKLPPPFLPMLLANFDRNIVRYSCICRKRISGKMAL
jgi:hypothetical protein